MNATQNATTVPTVAAATTPAVRKLVHGDRIAVKLKNYRGEIPTYFNDFTVGSVRGYAAQYSEDEEDAVKRAVSLGHNLYYAFNEGAMLTAHPQERIERTEVALGDIIEMDGQRFKVTPAPNQNIELVATV